MKATRPAPILFGPTGQPLRPRAGVYPTISNVTHRYIPRTTLNKDTRRNITPSNRKELVNNSRLLFARLGNLGSAIIAKNSWAFLDAWEPHYTGANDAWGSEATQWLREQWMPNADRHGRYDWRTLLYLSGVAWDRDGDDLMILTEADNGSGFPKVEFIPGVRIGNGPEDEEGGSVVGGPYDGWKIYDGVIYDPRGKAVAVRVLGENGENQAPPVLDVPIGFGGTGDLAYQPEWCDQGRGVPLVGRVMTDWMNLEDIDSFIQRGVKRASSVGLVQKTADGQAPPNAVTFEESETGASGTARTIHYEEVEGGEIYYLSAPDGESIEGVNYQNPHSNVEAFISRIERRGISAVGWAYELIYLNESGRAATRLVCDLANQSIWKQQALGLRRTWRAIRYALAKAMKNGLLARNPDMRDAFFSWDFGLPAPLSVDAGNDEQADRENIKLGTTNKALVAQKKGLYWAEIARQRKTEIISNAAAAAEIEQATAGKVTFAQAFELMEQRAPNPTASQAEPMPAPQPDDKP